MATKYITTNVEVDIELNDFSTAEIAEELNERLEFETLAKLEKDKQKKEELKTLFETLCTLFNAAEAMSFLKNMPNSMEEAMKIELYFKTARKFSYTELEQKLNR